MNQAASMATHASVHELACALELDEVAHRRAIELARLVPTPEDWVHYLDRFLVAAGTLLLLVGFAAFFAWNWSGLGHLTKLVLVQAGLLATVAAVCYLNLDTIAGRAALLAAAVLVGVLLALFGQAYQTGADPYGLFVAWALLMLPWTIAGRQPGLWLLWLALLNVSLILFWTQVLFPPPGWWQLTQLLGPVFMLSASVMDWRLATALFALNLSAVVVWEWAARADNDWLQSRALPRTAAVLALATVVGPTLVLILAATIGESSGVNVASPLLLTAALCASLFYYRDRKRDLFMLTAATFAAILVVTAIAIRLLLHDFESLLLLALLLIAQVAGAACWLRRVATRWDLAA